MELGLYMCFYLYLEWVRMVPNPAMFSYVWWPGDGKSNMSMMVLHLHLHNLKPLSQSGDGCSSAVFLRVSKVSIRFIKEQTSETTSASILWLRYPQKIMENNANIYIYICIHKYMCVFKHRLSHSILWLTMWKKTCIFHVKIATIPWQSHNRCISKLEFGPWSDSRQIHFERIFFYKWAIRHSQKWWKPGKAINHCFCSLGSWSIDISKVGCPSLYVPMSWSNHLPIFNLRCFCWAIWMVKMEDRCGTTDVNV